MKSSFTMVHKSQYITKATKQENHKELYRQKSKPQRRKQKQQQFSQLGAVSVPETFWGRVLHGDSTGTAWGRLENLVVE
ncbi:hypothetical protein N665_0240s0024 [Sinapis alba]|nr:hypothetical protein N665_0240s0024 [Sinapis alba]KAF8099651.1 hypothetical protein N665_0240s0024 [Sinapis alba]